MHAQVPQFIDIEDRIVGPLTIRQFGYLAAGAVAVGILYMLFQLYVVIIFSLPIILLSLALAFYQINGRPFVYFLVGFLGYGLKQHIYIWKKPLEEYGIFIQQKTTEKQPIFFEKVVEFAQSSLKKNRLELEFIRQKSRCAQNRIFRTRRKLQRTASGESLMANR